MRNLLLLFLSLTLSALSAQSAFTVYNHLNSDLPDDYINNIYIDADQNVWVCTLIGLAKLDPEGNWTIFNSGNSGLPDDNIQCAYVDNNGILYVGTLIGGFATYDGVTWNSYSPDNSPLPDYQVKCFMKDSNDTMWIGTTAGAVKWDGLDYWYTYTIGNSDLLSHNVNVIYQAENGVIYMGTVNGGVGVYADGAISIYWLGNSDISDNTILAIDEDASNNIWMATSFGGLSILTPLVEFLNFTPFTSDITELTVPDMQLDNDGVGMLAMSTTGLNIFANPDWTNINSGNSDLPDDFLTALDISSDNRVWLGTQTAGLVVYDKSFVSVQNQQAAYTNIAYPNPADHILFLNIPHTSCYIYDMQGKRVQKGTTDLFLNTRELADGLYMVELHDETNVYRQRVLIAHAH
ncbi:MAG: two-component regulator propeller domain-containing protein [Chitinophagales bacterium]